MYANVYNLRFKGNNCMQLQIEKLWKIPQLQKIHMIQAQKS